MEEEQDLVRLVLAAAQRKVRGVTPREQSDLDGAVGVGGQRLRVVLPEIRHADGEPLRRIGNVEPSQRSVARRDLRLAGENPVAS